MNPHLQLAPLASASGMGRILALAFAVCAASISQLQAQSSLPAETTGQSATVILPEDPSFMAKPSGPGAGTTLAAANPDGKPFTFRLGQNPMQPAVPSWDAATGKRNWSRPAPDLFLPGANFGDFHNTGTFDLNFYGGGTVQERSRLAGSGQNQFGAGRRPARGAYGTFGSAPGTAPSLSDLMRGRVGVPITPSPNQFRLSYRPDKFSPNSNGTGLDFNRMIATGMFTSPDLGNGMHFSAGTSYNTHSMGGSPTAGVKGTGPAVAIKLQF